MNTVGKMQGYTQELFCKCNISADEYPEKTAENHTYL